MIDAKMGVVMGTGAAINLWTGFAPDYVEVTNQSDYIFHTWYRLMAADSALYTTAAGTRTIPTTRGIIPIKITGTVGDETVATAESSDTDNINGFQITSDAECNTNANILLWKAHKYDCRVIRAVHDGTTSSNTYFEDSSLDFRELGVTAGWVIINASNDNRTAVVSVTRPAGKAKYCRVNVLSTLTADFDTADVCFLMPPEDEQLTAITAMT